MSGAPIFAIAIVIPRSTHRKNCYRNGNHVINRRCERTLTQALSIRGAMLDEDESLCTSGTFHISIRWWLFMYP